MAIRGIMILTSFLTVSYFVAVSVAPSDSEIEKKSTTMNNRHKLSREGSTDQIFGSGLENK